MDRQGRMKEKSEIKILSRYRREIIYNLYIKNKIIEEPSDELHEKQTRGKSYDRR